KEAGYSGTELGPVGFMPEDPAILASALAERRLSLIGGVVFSPFHDPARWEEVQDSAVRTCRALKAHGAKLIVLIDSISPDRELTAGRSQEAERLTGQTLKAFSDRLRTVAKMASEEFGLTTSIHAHAGGYVEFEDELERILEHIDSSVLKVCLDTGHSVYAGFDPVAFYLRYAERVSYLHLKDIDPDVKDRIIGKRIGFYDACAQGLFCNLGTGAVDFASLREALQEKGFSGWATVEQDCDPAGPTSSLADAKANLNFLRTVDLGK
ncbi:MAG: TIM barrel protein, partial [Verrucomicrobia bacterium]|nr:TIM barrel protein [Verrucomicrobiota bacterium]